LVGLAPIANESGKLKGKRFISGGRFEARRTLYMPAWVATQYNPEFATFYQRLINNGKTPKVAITAVMRKLLVRLNAIMRNHHMQSL
jgi:transposase